MRDNPSNIRAEDAYSVVCEKMSALPSLTPPTCLLYDTCVLPARDHRFLGYTSSWYFRVRLQLSCVCHMHTLACYLSSTKDPTSQHMINFAFEVQGCFVGNASCSNVYRHIRPPRALHS